MRTTLDAWELTFTAGRIHIRVWSYLLMDHVIAHLNQTLLGLSSCSASGVQFPSHCCYFLLSLLQEIFAWSPHNAVAGSPLEDVVATADADT